MVDWNTGKPNARLWVLKLLRENFGPGDKLVEMEKMDEAVSRHVYSLAVIKPDGKRRFLLVNKRDRPFDFRRSVRDPIQPSVRSPRAMAGPCNTGDH